jgi:hypothetical protein
MTILKKSLFLNRYCTNLGLERLLVIFREAGGFAIFVAMRMAGFFAVSGKESKRESVSISMLSR